MERKLDPVENSASNTALNPSSSTTNSPFKCKFFGKELASCFPDEDTSPGGESTSPASKSKVYPCTKCNSRFPTKQGLGGHMRTHKVSTAKRRRVDDSDAGEKILQAVGNLKGEEEVKTASSSDIIKKKESGSVIDLNLRL